MITKHKSWLFAALFVLIGVFAAQAQNAVHNKAYFDAITYQWTDANGVTHENAVSEVATDPYQIVALLKKVYCDPNIPGPLYSAYDEDGNREREVYYGAVDGGWNISADDVTAPYEDGYTILMVALNNHLTLQGNENDYYANYFTQTNQLINYIRNNVTSVQLLCDGLRVGSGENAGTSFNISGEYNRFFLLGKGQARQKDSWVTTRENYYGVIAGEEVPFKQMFEQFSPTSGLSGSEVKDFYAKMVNGEVFPVVHDCMSVIENEHDFTMAGKNNEEYKSLTGMNIFVPDYRLKYWEKDTSWQETEWVIIIPVQVTVEGNYDARTQNPYKTVDGKEFGDPRYLTANYAVYNQDHAPRMGIYTIKLDANAAPAAEEGTYTVVLDWTSSLNTLAGGEEVPQTYTVYIVDQYGYNYELAVTDQTTYTYEVPQEDHSYTITYVIYGQPSDGDHDMFVVWSNTDDVIIPGTNDFLAMGLDHFESDYDIDAEVNYYRNFFTLANFDDLNAFTVDRVAAGENEFVLYRYDMENSDVMTAVADVHLAVQGNGVGYTVEYQEQVMRPNYNIDVTTQGTLDVNDGVIDMSGLTLVDQFSADVSENMHPNRYGYVLALANATAAKTTNTVEVPVHQTYGFNLAYYTKEEVNEDRDATLQAGVKNAYVDYELDNVPEVYYIDLLRGDNAAPNDMISHLQRRTDGSFIEFSGALPEYTGNLEYYWASRHDTNVITGEYGDFMTYVPVIKTFGEDRVKKDGENTYGSNIYKTGVAGLDISVDGTVSVHGSYANWYDENNQECAVFNPVISINALMPDYATWEYRPYLYRVWLKCDNRRYADMDENGHLVNDTETERENFELIVEDYIWDGETEVFYGDPDNDELAFGATYASKDGGISFLVRMYYEVQADIPLKNAKYPSWMPVFYVVEKEIPWTNIPTSVNEITSNTVVATTYYNAQGLASDKPFNGVNIVVTKFSDGTTKTAKVIR